MFKLNHPRIALFQLHHFSWNPYCWWRHHLWMTSLLPFWWRHVTWSHFIWCNFGPSMILPSFITNGSFLEILRQNSWILGVFDSSYQGLLLEGPKRGWRSMSSNFTSVLTMFTEPVVQFCTVFVHGVKCSNKLKKCWSHSGSMEGIPVSNGRLL